MEISAVTDNQKQSKFPMIIAMKGPSNKEKSEIVRKLAAFLQCPLIDEEDIIPNLQNSIPSSSIESNDLPFKIVSQICSTELYSKLRVIINTPLSQHTQFNHLVQLANSKEASMIIIECKTPNNQDLDWSDMKEVPKISIDITKTFVVKDFVPEMLKFAELKRHQVLDPSKGLAVTDHSVIVDRKFAERHAHEFSLIADPTVAGSDRLCCNFCKKIISGATYKCIECDEFILHKACAELPDKLDYLDLARPQFLEVNNPSNYDFPEHHKCNPCEHFSEFCSDCLFQTHIEFGHLPTIITYDRHEHPLNFVIMPFWFDFQFKCFRCDELGKSISYKCYHCNFDLHVNCALPKVFRMYRCCTD